ncbi:MAG: hypothetical protein POELPBGB_01496 [Bacteroidia bacterium]|nr:hypothetical protein [Bacteroidia bacterium]
MKIPHTFEGLIEKGFHIFAISTVRYLLFAGVAYLFFYLLFKNKWLHKRIQQKFPENSNIFFEIKYSMLNMVIFGITGMFTIWASWHGWTKIYAEISDYGMVYFLFSIIAMIFVHDTYFYWTHRFMHLKKVFPLVHKVHHHSLNPTPWAAFSFHPIEGFIEAGILPLITFLFPVHPLAILIFLLFMTALNVLGHLGFEMYPKGFTKHPLLGLNNTSTHHNMHHSLTNCNYGLYFNFWDKWMGTNHKKYHETFEKLAAQKASSDTNTVIKETVVLSE